MGNMQSRGDPSPRCLLALPGSPGKKNWALSIPVKKRIAKFGTSPFVGGKSGPKFVRIYDKIKLTHNPPTGGKPDREWQERWFGKRLRMRKSKSYGNGDVGDGGKC